LSEDEVRAIAHSVSGYAPAEEEKDNVRAIIAELAVLSPIEYDQVRKAKADELDVRVRILDKLVAQAGNTQTESQQGRAVLFVDPEPWHETVDGVALLDKLAAAFKRYLVLPEHAPEVLAVWVLHTHVFEVAHATPYLAITSPQPECGKSRLLDVLQCLCRRGYRNTNISAPVL
jgi:putative DNA primase/helicase